MKKQKCPICGNEFKTYPSQNRTYCSRICMKEGYSQRFSGEGNPNSKNPIRYCEACGKKLHRKTCGNRCSFCRDLAGESNPFYKKSHSQDARKLMSKNHVDVSGEKNTFYGKIHTEAAIKKMSSAGKKRWKNASEEERKVIVSNLMRGLEKQRSGEYTEPEIIVAMELDKLEISFDHNAPLYGKFFVDFLLPNGDIIEVFGDYWHGNPRVFRKLNNTQLRQQGKDRSRIAYLKKCGHSVFVLWECDIKKDPTIVGDVIAGIGESS